MINIYWFYIVLFFLIILAYIVIPYTINILKYRRKILIENDILWKAIQLECEGIGYFSYGEKDYYIFKVYIDPFLGSKTINISFEEVECIYRNFINFGYDGVKNWVNERMIINDE